MPHAILPPYQVSTIVPNCNENKNKNSTKIRTKTDNAMVQTSISSWLTKPKILPVEIHHQPKQLREPQPCAVASASTIEHQSDTTLQHIGHGQGEKEQEKEQVSYNASVQAKRSTLKCPPLPPNASLASITPEHLPGYMRMTALLLPIPYPKQFFQEILDDSVTASICLVALWSQPSIGVSHNRKQKVVSGIRCRLLAHSPVLSENGRENSSHGQPTLYIAALTTLAPYRGHGLASALFRRVLSRAINEYEISTVTAHRWEANEEAQGWYAHHGFREVEFAQDYYRRLKPSGAFLLERKIGPNDLLRDDENDEENPTWRSIVTDVQLESNLVP